MRNGAVEMRRRDQVSLRCIARAHTFANRRCAAVQAHGDLAEKFAGVGLPKPYDGIPAGSGQRLTVRAE